MEYKDAVEWLFKQLPMFSRVGAAAYKPGLERCERLSDYFNNPHRNFKSIHIAGTNGKGSVSNIIASVLQAQGYKVGLYTSPHLIDFRERMRINGTMIPEHEVINFVEKWQLNEYNGDKPSFFELTMIMAFDWFSREKVDYAVIEVGMGGRLDSTNIITPLLSIITNISKDHTQFLGETFEKIAAEKAGIIKSGIPVVIGEANLETEKVFRQKAIDMDSPIRFAFKENQSKKENLIKCDLRGDYQKKNIHTALIALDELKKSGVMISDESIFYGFSHVEESTGFKGRWTIISNSPLTICDTGHNEAGLKYNLSQLENITLQKGTATIRFIIGFVADKDIDNILKLFPSKAKYYLTQADIPRALEYKELESKFKSINFHGNITSYKCVEEAWTAALKESNPEDIIFIGGSTFIVADAMKLIKSKKISLN